MHCYLCLEPINDDSTWATLFTIHDEKICPECANKFERINGPNLCKKCMKINVKEVCEDCEAWDYRLKQDPLARNVSIFTYNDEMKDVMARFKYRGDYELVYIWEKGIQKAFQQYFTPNIPAVPIPLSEERYKERGFNQAEAIAQLISEPFNLLTREHREKQSKKTKHERILSQNPFRVTETSPNKVLIIDDIFTTGTTIRQAAQVLKDAGAQTVYSLTLVRS